VGAGDARDDRATDSAAILTALHASGERALVSDLVLAETVTILGRRPGVGPRRAAAVADRLLRVPQTLCLHLDDDALIDTPRVYERFGPALSFADASTVVLMARVGCRTLYSHDAGFDRVPTIERKARP